MPVELRILHHDGVLLLAAHDDLFIQCWSGRGTADQVRAMFEAHTRFVERLGHRTSVALSHVTSPSVTPPDEPSRKIMNEHVRLLARVRAIATVIEADGFGAAMIRGIVSGLLLLGSRETAHQVFSTPRDGLEFALRHRDPSRAPMSLDAVLQGYEAVRAERRPP